MRKKLLALMMCATMVLGTATTAFAAAKPKEADLKAAGDILKAGAKFVSEYKIDELKNVTWTETNNDGKDITWGLVDYVKAVKLNSDKKPLVHKSDVTARDYKKNAAGKEYVNAAGDEITAGDGVYFLRKSNGDTATKADLYTTDAVAGTTITSDVAEKIKAVNPSASSLTVKVFEVDGDVDKSVVGYSIAGDNDTYISLVDANGYKIATAVVAGATTATTVNANPTYIAKPVLYTDADKVYGEDGYYPNEKVVYNVGTLSQEVYDVDGEGFINKVADVTLTQLAPGIASDGYYVDLYTSTDGDYKKAIANSLVGNNTVTLSDKAVAVGLNLYELVKTEKNNGCQLYKLVQKNSSATDVTLTFKSDFLSHSKLDASSIHAYTIDKDDVKDGVMQIQDLNKVADGFSITTKDFTNRIFIFDAEAVESTDNAGQADADATKPATTDKADKTGDTAPIAALAVVMLGACGAMVVASKKRA